MIKKFFQSIVQPSSTLRRPFEPHISLSPHRTLAYDNALPPLNNLFNRVKAEAHTVHSLALMSTEQTEQQSTQSTWWFDCTHQTPRFAIEEAIVHLSKQFVQNSSSNHQLEITGAEWWIQHRHSTTPQHFHFDTDVGRHALTTATANGGADNVQVPIVRCPSLSSILYLTECGGPTVVLGQRPTVSEWTHQLEMIPAEATECDIMFPRVNRYMLFRGDMLHGVMPSQEKEMRTTLLVNWWVGKRPLSPACSDPTATLLSHLEGNGNGNGGGSESGGAEGSGSEGSRSDDSGGGAKGVDPEDSEDAMPIAMEVTDLQTGGEMLGSESLSCAKLSFDIDLSIDGIGSSLTTSAYMPTKLLDREDLANARVEGEKDEKENALGNAGGTAGKYSNVVHRIVGMGRLRLVENQYP